MDQEAVATEQPAVEATPVRKYEFTGKTKVEGGVTLKRIRALIEVRNIGGTLSGSPEDIAALTPEQIAALPVKTAQAHYDNLADHADDFGDADNLCSSQPLGDTQVLVAFSWRRGEPCIEGASINGEIVEADCFSPAVVRRWVRAIEREFGGEAS